MRKISFLIFLCIVIGSTSNNLKASVVNVEIKNFCLYSSFSIPFKIEPYSCYVSTPWSEGEVLISNPKTIYETLVTSPIYIHETGSWMIPVSYGQFTGYYDYVIIGAIGVKYKFEYWGEFVEPYTVIMNDFIPNDKNVTLSISIDQDWNLTYKFF